MTSKRRRNFKLTLLWQRQISNLSLLEGKKDFSRLVVSLEMCFLDLAQVVFSVGKCTKWVCKPKSPLNKSFIELNKISFLSARLAENYPEDNGDNCFYEIAQVAFWFGRKAEKNKLGNSITRSNIPRPPQKALFWLSKGRKWNLTVGSWTVIPCSLFLQVSVWVHRTQNSAIYKST
jgi:hypothetical protein